MSAPICPGVSCHSAFSVGSTNASERASNASKKVALPMMMRARTCQRQNGTLFIRASNKGPRPAGPGAGAAPGRPGEVGADELMAIVPARTRCPMQSRRHFVHVFERLGYGREPPVLLSSISSAAFAAVPTPMQFVLFTDNLADLSVRAACRAAKGAGFDGLDLTLRAGGHVDPAKAQAGLAEAHAIADEEHVTIAMVSTAITDVDSPHAEAVVSAAHHRIRNFKLGYWRYEGFGNLTKQLNDARRKLERLVQLCTRYGIRPCVHIHSGPILSNGPLLYLLLK